MIISRAKQLLLVGVVVVLHCSASTSAGVDQRNAILRRRRRWSSLFGLPSNNYNNQRDPKEEATDHSLEQQHPPTLLPSRRRSPSFSGPFQTNHLSAVLSSSRTSVVPSSIVSLAIAVRGGYQEQEQEEASLDEKVHAAMQKLGLKPPPPPRPPSTAEGPKTSTTDPGASATEGGEGGGASCEGGVCSIPNPQQISQQQPPPLPPMSSSSTSSGDTKDDFTAQLESTDSAAVITEDQVMDAAQALARHMNVDYSLALAALSATSSPASSTNEDDATNQQQRQKRVFHLQAARAMIQQELDMVEQIPADSPQVHALTAEGFNDLFLCRRALAFAEGNLDDARAILLADQEDEDEQQQAESAELDQKEVFPTVTVDSNLDPTNLPQTSSSSGGEASKSTTSGGDGDMPKPAKKEDVVFEATTEQIHELVLESPVPVLLDVYADWCGPCKVLTPALEQMAQKSGGLFRLVKVNTDKEKSVSTALEVTALPTVFGVKNGKIVHMFQGMPRSEDAMKNFMQGLLIGENSFDPPLSQEQKSKYTSLTTKLVKTAGSASFPFSARERLKDRVQTLLENLVVQNENDISKAQESAKIVRSLLNNIIQNPTQVKFRTVKLENAVLAGKVAPFPAATGLLKSVGFRQQKKSNQDGKADGILALSTDKAFVNVAPLVVARDCIEQWLDNTKREAARAARQRHDEAERARLNEEGAFDQSNDEDEDDDTEQDELDNLNTCLLKVRFAGKKKVYPLSLAATDRLSNVLDQLPGLDKERDSSSEEIQITCIAKKLVVKSTDKRAMEEKTLQELGLTPGAALVVEVKQKTTDSGEDDDDMESSSHQQQRKSSKKTKLSQRVRKKKKKGSHTMQSVGIYSKDDNAKGELIDGGGGVWYEHDVSDDEDEGEEKPGSENDRQKDDADSEETQEEEEEEEETEEEREE